ncbi:hypothetical protein Cni_G06823 [Canna indica]|uniref:Protein N-terminal asparagine amidohydrolase n=1 Tax=Canna indica TaxID=4628 RepID=A0AAQ3JZA5_9LILI|nr:hypothetical protein Cni_G06823 [Canna indica]
MAPVLAIFNGEIIPQSFIPCFRSTQPKREKRTAESRTTMIFVDGLPLPPSSPSEGREILAALLEHPFLISSADRLKATPWTTVSSTDPRRLVYVCQREYATVDPALVQLVGTDKVTTCVGLVIRSRNSGLTSVSHMDFPSVVNNGLQQMLSSINGGETIFDVHLVGGFDDGPKNRQTGGALSQKKKKTEGFSLPLCSQLIEALHRSQQKFYLQTLCVLRHNTNIDLQGNACPIISGFLVDTSSGSLIPASFDEGSRGPDEIVRDVRLSLCSEDPNWKGKLLETYNTHHDRFEIAPCSWMSYWRNYALSMLQLSDSEFLLRSSTSPYAEGPHFVENQRRKWNYLIENPDWRHTFAENKPRIFQRTRDGRWLRCA